MPDAAAWLPDTNILLRMNKIDDPQYPTINGAVRALCAQGARLCFTSQTLSEPPSPYCGSSLDVKADTLVPLQETNDLEKISRARITGGAEHPHEALRGNTRGFSESGK